jgi:hypothetical protein
MRYAPFSPDHSAKKVIAQKAEAAELLQTGNAANSLSV